MLYKLLTVILASKSAKCSHDLSDVCVGCLDSRCLSVCLSVCSVSLPSPFCLPHSLSMLAVLSLAHAADQPSMPLCPGSAAESHAVHSRLPARQRSLRYRQPLLTFAEPVSARCCRAVCVVILVLSVR